MLYAGLDLSRKRLDFRLIDADTGVRQFVGTGGGFRGGFWLSSVVRGWRGLPGL